MIATLLRPTSGSLSVLGHDPARAPREVRRQLGYMPDVLGVYDNLRVDEYLQFFAASYRVPRKEWPGLVDGLLELVDLNVKSTSLVNSLSRGMKQRLSLARTLVHDPELLVLDEPASGLDPRARVELRDTLRQLNQMGKTIIVSSHILAELEEMCTEVAIMEAGKLLASGTPRQIMDTARPGEVDLGAVHRRRPARRSRSPTTTSRSRCSAASPLDERARRPRVPRGALRPRGALHVHHRRDRPVSSPHSSLARRSLRSASQARTGDKSPPDCPVSDAVARKSCPRRR